MSNRAALPLGPSPHIEAMLAPVVSHILNRSGTQGLITLAVLGSAARGEETWRMGKLVGDVDLAAVVRFPDPWTARRFEAAAEGLPYGVHLGAIWDYRLSSYRTLYLYEARHSAHVLWGADDAFARVRMLGASDIPRWEALRLLLNRMMECLVPRTGNAPLWYTAVKTYLALAEAELIFDGRYQPSYRGRWDQIAARRSVLGSKELFERIEWAARLKLNDSSRIGCIKAREHEEWLLMGLGLLVSRYLGRNVNLETGIQLLGHQITNYIHRVVQLRENLTRPTHWRHTLTIDPIFPIWQQGALTLLNNSRTDDLQIRDLLSQWKHAYQPLKK